MTTPKNTGLVLAMFVWSVLFTPLSAPPPPRDPFDPWHIENAMTTPRGAPGVALWRNHIYAMGGLGTSSTQTSVEFAPLASDGSVGSWQLTSALTKPRYGLAAVAAQGKLLAIGGKAQYGVDPITGVVESATVNADHSVGNWTVTSPMTTARKWLAAVVWQNHLYALGGSRDFLPLETVEMATVQPDGSLSAWQLTSPLTTARDGLAAVVAGNYIYALGGRYYSDSYHSLDSIERAAINTDGSLGAWQVIGSMQLPRFSLQAVISGNYLCALGGSNETGGGTYLNSVEMAEIYSDGSLGPWQFGIPMVSPRTAFGAIGWQNNLYAIGGITDSGYLDTVERTGSALLSSFLYLPIITK